MRVVLLLTMLCFLGFTIPEEPSHRLSVPQLEEQVSENDPPNLICRSRGNLSVNGNVITITDLQVRNVGFSTSSVSYVGYYLSLDQNFTTSDIYLGQDYVKGLAPSEISVEDFMIDISTMSIPNGEYFVGIIVDHLNNVQETNELDNTCFWETPKVVVGGKPDLTCAEVGEIECEGNRIHITWANVKNIGNAPAGASKSGFYLSSNNILSTDDIFIGELGVSPLLPGEKEMMPALNVDLDTVNIPNGEYFIGFIVDYKNQVAESNENNNKECLFEKKIKVNKLPAGKPNLACKDRGELKFNASTLTVSITGTRIQNFGNVPADANKVAYVLSKDLTFNTEDVIIAVRDLGALAPDTEQTLSPVEVNLTNLNLPSGTYYVGVLIDYTNLVEESNENDNNTCFWEDPKIVIPNGKPNLTCKDKGEVIVQNNTLDVYLGWTTVINNGNARAGRSQIGFYLSTDQTFTTGDILFATADIPELAPGESFMIPDNGIRVNLTSLGLAPGTYFIGVIIDYRNQVEESNEADNATCSWDEPRVFIPQAGKPNLTCKDKGEVIVQNNTLDVYLGWTTVINNGNARAGRSQIGFYLSTDQTFTTGDILFATADIPELAPGESFMIPDNGIRVNLTSLGLAPGTYFIGVIIDYRNQVEESNEADNATCSWDEPRVFIPQAGKPNLTCKDKGEVIVQNNTLDVYLGWTTVINNGNARAGRSQIGFYLSTDQTFTTGDILFATADIPELAPGESFMIPDNGIRVNLTSLGLAPGTYFIGVIIDYRNQVEESNEADNATCSWDEPRVFIPQAGKPNLTCRERGNLNVNGTNFTINNLRITNNGNATAGASKIGVYLSSDQNFTTGDFLVGTIDVPALNAGQVFTGNFSGNANSVPAGDYFVGFIVDYTNVVAESNENDNNTCSWENPKVHIPAPKPNLTCREVGRLEVSGTNISISNFRVTNNGGSTANATTVGIYLSGDQTFTTGDFLVGTVNLPKLDPGQVFTGSFSVNVANSGVPAGDYFVGLIIDPQDKVHESNEHDNTCFFNHPKVHIPAPKPNLTCREVGRLEVSGTNISISNFRVTNNGGSTANATTVGIYLSGDQTFTTGDFLVGTVNLPKLDPGQVFTGSFSVNVANSGVPAGDYFVGLIIDPQDKVHESNEHDNTCFFNHPKVHIPAPKPNLTCENGGEISVNGTNVHISWVKVINKGGSRSNATKVGFYLSRDQNFTTSDFLIGTVNLAALNPGEIKMLNEFSINVSGLGIPAGDYFVGIIIDPFDDVHESNEHDNNTCFFRHPKVHIPAPKPNLTCKDRGEISASGSTIRISWVKVANMGGSTAGASRVGFYLSTDTHFTTSDIYIGEVAVGSIGAGQVVTLSDFTRDLSGLHLPAGDYFIGFLIDYKDQVHESDEHDNNTCFFTHPKVRVHPSKPNLACKNPGELVVNGTQLHHSWGMVINDGRSRAGTFRVGYFLSKDRNFRVGEDIFLGEATVHGLDANQVVTLPNVNFNLAGLSIPAGTYYFGFIIDYKDNVDETNEHDNNNCFIEHPRIHIEAGKPDLTCKDKGEFTYTGNNIHISWVKVMNNGASSSNAARIGYYLSTDTNIDPSHDFFIGSQHIPALGAGQVATIADFSKNISSLNIPSGSYFLGYYVDDKFEVHESNEHNNGDCVWTHPKINISAGKPNLAIHTTGHFSVSGHTLQFSNVRVVNNGGSSTGGTSKLGFYLSRDANVDPNEDILIGTDNIPNLNPGQTSNSSRNINLAGLSIPSGTYYVGIFADNEFKIHESNEHDNSAVYTQRINFTSNTGKPDLACAGAGTLDIQGNNKVSITGLKVTNAGTNVAGNSQIGVYLSSDQNFTTGDFFIGALNVPSLNPGQTATLTFSGTLPEVPNGTYFVGFILDYNNRISESNEHNNNECFFTHPKVTINKNTGYNVGNSPACACENSTRSSFCDNFETYTASTFINRAPCWTTWSGSNQEMGYLIGDGNNKCMRIEGRGASNQNTILKLGNRTNGNYRIDFGMRILSSRRGYFTLMQGTGNQASHSCQVILYNNGTGTVKHGTGETHFYYPNNNAAGWFKVSLMVDVDSDKASLMFNDSHAATWKYSERVGSNGTMKQLAALNFTAMDPGYLYDIDEIEFRQIASSENGDVESRNDEFATSATLPSISVSYYPNPVSGNLFLDLETPEAVKVQVEIVNTIGQVVARHEESDVTILNKVFDLSNQPGGMYYIKCLVGDQQIVKPLIVIKN